MLAPPQKNLLEALASLEHNRDFKIVSDFFQQSLDLTRDSLVDSHCEQDTLRLQGAGKVLREFIGLSSDARNIIARQKKN